MALEINIELFQLTIHRLYGSRFNFLLFLEPSVALLAVIYDFQINFNGTLRTKICFYTYFIINAIRIYFLIYKNYFHIVIFLSYYIEMSTYI